MRLPQRSTRSIFRPLFAVCFVILLAGCGADRAFTPTVTTAPVQQGGGVAAPATSSSSTNQQGSDAIAVNVILTDYRITSFTTGFEVGKTYAFTVSNNGAVVHGFTIEAAGTINQPLTSNGQTATIAIVNPGESQTLTWTFATVAKLQIASHLNDDYAKGMVKTGLAAS